MIVWSGRGFISIIVLLVTLVACVSIFPTENADYRLIITAFVTGIFSWFFGKKWNSNNERIVVDEKTGERLKLKNNHSLFWIPMQYFGVIFTAIGTIIAFQNSLMLGFVTAVGFLVIAFLTFMPQKDKLKDNTILTNASNVNTGTRFERSNSTTNSNTNDVANNSSNSKEFESSDHNKFMPK